MKSLSRLRSANSIRLSHVSRGFPSLIYSQRNTTTSADKHTCVNPLRFGPVRECNHYLLCRTEEPHIAVLGAGITGLSAAYHLARRFPTTKITLIEGSNRVGGWLDSQRVHIGNGTVLLEKGPRTLRSSSKATLELVGIHHLLYMC